MKAYRAAIGTVLLCAFVFCAAAPSAMAETKTTTAYKCEKVTKGAKLKDEHCTTSQSGGGEGFLHTSIAENTAIETASDNEKTNSLTNLSTNVVMVIRIALTRGDITCEKWELTGSVKNINEKVEPQGPKRVKGEKLKSLFTKCTLSKELAENGCVIKGGQIEGSNIASRTIVDSQESEFTGEGGKGLWTVSLEKCSNMGFNGNWEMSGALMGIPTGAVMTFIETGSPLKLGKEPASLSGKLTLRNKTGVPIIYTTEIDLP
jgi:hypothetical protein